MKIKVTVVRMGGGFLKAVFGQSWSAVTGRWEVDSVFGRDEEELLARLKTRLPALKNHARGSLSRNVVIPGRV